MSGVRTAGVFARRFFDLQVDFAEVASRLSGRALAETLLDYTNFYVRFGFGRAFEPTHPGWQAYLAGVQETGDCRAWTYRFYLERAESAGPPGVVATFGCFSYARVRSDRIRLHFHSAGAEGPSPLAFTQRDRRVAEMAALFTHVKETVHEPVRVAGASWLYNLEAYRRLFPASYLATARVLPRAFRHLPLWGQFLNRAGEVRHDVAEQFRERLGHRTRVDDLDHCFPFQVLAVEAPVRDFYAFHGIRSAACERT